MFFKTLLAALFCSLVASIAIASNATPFKNMDQIANAVGIHRYAAAHSARTVKIAILDNGFAGREKEIGKTLPASTVYHVGPIAVDAKNEEAHGLYMAEILSGLLARTPGVSYELHLFSAFGYSNLAAAVQAVVAGGFDVVLYSQVWEYGGNGDGRGFINSLVNQATAAGLIWINAAGNFGASTYRAPVEVWPDEWAYLPSPNHGVRVRCFENKAKKCRLRAVLSWNDFKDQPEIGTDKDLDLVLSDDTLKVLRTGGLQQVVSTPADGNPGTSLYPREIVEAELAPGLYELRVKARSKNFAKTRDSLRIVTSGDYIQQIDTSAANETLLAPADNAGVITVGASDSEKTSASSSMGKPEFSLASEVSLKNGDTFKGSSNSAAMTAALAVIARGLNPSVDRAGVLAFLRDDRWTPAPSAPSSGVPTAPAAQAKSEMTYQDLGFGPTGPGCFKAAFLPSVPDAAKSLVSSGAFTVETNAGFKIMIGADPFTLGLGVPNREKPDDMLVVGPKGFRVYSRSLQLVLPPGTYEVLQTPSNAVFCR